MKYYSDFYYCISIYKYRLSVVNKIYLKWWFKFKIEKGIFFEGIVIFLMY